MRHFSWYAHSVYIESERTGTMDVKLNTPTFGYGIIEATNLFQSTRDGSKCSIILGDTLRATFQHKG
jgi:hypothetical protein